MREPRIELLPRGPVESDDDERRPLRLAAVAEGEDGRRDDHSCHGPTRDTRGRERDQPG